MRRHSLIFLLLLMGLALGGFFFYRQPAEIRISQPAAVPPGSGSVRSYQIDVVLDPAARRLAGVCRLTLQNDLQHSLGELFFHLYPNAFRSRDTTPAPPAAYPAGFVPGGMEVGEIKVEYQPAPAEVQGTVLRVSLPRALPAGGRVEVEIPFELTIPAVAYRFGQWDGVTALGNWYPVLAVYDESGWHLDPYLHLGDPFYSQAADYQVVLTIPTEQVVAASGLPESEEILGGGWKRILLKVAKVRDLALVTSARFHLETLQDGDITLRAYSLSGHEDSSRLALSAASRALQFYRRTFACPYPYRQFSLVEVPMQGLNGMEYPLMAMISSREFAFTSLSQWQPLIAHEVAHQWWYGLVGSDQWREPWIDEGMAVWSTELLLRELNQTGPRRKRAPPSPGSVLYTLEEFSDASEYYTLAYLGGSLFWEALEGHIGRDRVCQLWSALAAEYQFREISTYKLLELIDRVAGKAVGDFARGQLGILSTSPRAGASDSNAVNNIISGEVGAGSRQPDLTVENASVYRRGEKNCLIVRVMNRGTQAAGEFAIAFREPDSPGWVQKLAGLPPGRTYTFSCSTTGWGTAVVDCYDQVAESNENNNFYSYRDN